MATPYPALALVVLTACAGASSPSSPPSSTTPPPDSPEAAGPRPIKPSTRLADVAAAKVFDEHGNASPCDPPQATCPSLPVSNAFLDRCRLAGFRVRQCGCEQRCGGDVAALTRHYDADGHQAECPPAHIDCTPPQAGAAFQDACAEHGFRLDVCGCGWLCSGDFKK